MSSRAAVAQPQPYRQAARTALLPMVLFCLGHYMIDMYSSALGALQPLLRERYGITLTQAGLLGGALVWSSSVMQPFYGFLSDRWHSRLFTALAPAVAGIFISSLGWAPAYWALLLMVILGGTGIASFHPQATANATAGIQGNRSTAMAIFICSGTIGLASGPAVFSALAARGLALGGWGALPGILLTIVLLVFPQPLAGQANSRRSFAWEALRAVWKPMSLLYLLVVIRSVVQITFTQFLPLYLHTERGYSLAAASLTLTLYLTGGALGGLVGGTLADRFGSRIVILISMIGSVPFLALFLFTKGALSATGLFLGGLVLLFTIPINVVMAQELAPAQVGTASALMMGFGWGMAGVIFIPLTGWISDMLSMQQAFMGIIAFPLLGFLLALKLPKSAP